jgi:type IV pilus assembly protein PilX
MKHCHQPRFASRQRGVVLLFSLVALVVLLIAAVALMRSFNTSMFMAGNIAFKRDLQNQGERAMGAVLTSFATGALSTDTARSASSKPDNYSAVMLPTNAQGVPNALVVSDTDFFANWGAAGNDISETNEPSLANSGVKVRYIIDRMSNAVGSCSALGPGACIMANDTTPRGGSASDLQNPSRALVSAAAAAAAAASGVKPTLTGTAVYRLTVRVIGPRDTQAFFQSTFTAP